MLAWLIPVINIAGPAMVRLAEGLFRKKSPDAEKRGPEKKQFVSDWLMATWDLVNYLGLIPAQYALARDTVVAALGDKIEAWVADLKAKGKL
jgi:hypothetical protein